ncbi:MAG TPA: DinB family protein [Pyrinomonadaceae bacterium]|nr:DinB family protein [Pyrinomonadaceae bacterium]
MKFETIADIYDGNAKVRQRLKDLLSSLTDEQVSAAREGELWNVAEIVEHIAIVDESTLKICAKLLKKAEAAGQAANSVKISDGFMSKSREIAAMKVEAPDFVKPTGERSIEESIARLDENADRAAELRAKFETIDGTSFTFPHPFFGEITAHEWFALKGGHELRHLKQIERLLEQ